MVSHRRPPGRRLSWNDGRGHAGGSAQRDGQPYQPIGAVLREVRSALDAVALTLANLFTPPGPAWAHNVGDSGPMFVVNVGIQA